MPEEKPAPVTPLPADSSIPTISAPSDISRLSSGTTVSYRRGRWPKIAGLAVLALFVIGGAGTVAAYFTGYLDIARLLRRQSPAEVLEEVYKHLPEIKTASYALDLNIKTEPKSSAVQTLWLSPKKAAKVTNEQDRQTLGLVISLLPLIEGYKVNGDGYGIYYPRTLTDIAPSETFSQLPDLEQKNIIQYAQQNNGRSYLLVAKLQDSSTLMLVPQELTANGVNELAIGPYNQTLALTSLGEIMPSTSVAYEDYSVEAYNMIPTDFAFDFHATGQADNSTEAVKAGQYDLSGSLKLGGATFNGAVKIINDAENVYVQMQEFPSIGYFDLSAIKNKWVKIELAKTLSELKQDTTENTLYDLYKEQYLTAFNLFQELNMLTVKKELPTETDGKQMLYHYEIDIAYEKMPEFYQKLTQKLQEKFADKSTLHQDPVITNFLQSEQYRDYTELLRQQTKLEIWIDQDTYFPVRMQQTAITAAPAQVERLKEIQFVSKTSVSLNDINEETKITTPSEFITQEDAMKLIYSPLMMPQDSFGQSAQATTDAKIKSLMGQLRVLSEVYYDTKNSSYAGLEQCLLVPDTTVCNDSRESPISPSVARLTKELAELTPSKPLTVHATTTDFCISHGLSSAGKTVCVDSAGSVNTTDLTTCLAATAQCGPENF